MRELKKAVFAIVFATLMLPQLHTVHAQSQNPLPHVNDPDLIVEQFFCCLSSTTAMTFVTDNDILILSKNDGRIFHIKEGILQNKPLVDFNVNGIAERGLLGITHVGRTVYVYLTESYRDAGLPIGNRIYRFEWNGTDLIDQVLVSDLPVNTLHPSHNAGAMTVGLENEIYAVVGDNGLFYYSQTQDTLSVPDVGAIIRVDTPGTDVRPVLSSNTEQFYFARGIRNSFGIAIDPVTGSLWDTENGPENFDEINLVRPKSNGGWNLVMGPATDDQKGILSTISGYKYDDPAFSWERPTVPTGLSFVSSDQFANYKDSLFVGTCSDNLYRFKLNEDRTAFVFHTI